MSRDEQRVHCAELESMAHRAARHRSILLLDKLGGVCARTPPLPVTTNCSEQNTYSKSETCYQDMRKRLRREKTENSDWWQKKSSHCARVLNGRMGRDLSSDVTSENCSEDVQHPDKPHHLECSYTVVACDDSQLGW